MRLLDNLLFMAIIIEVWHIVYYSYFKQYYFDRVIKIVNWAQNYRKMYDSLMKYSDDYANNKELQVTMPELCNPMLEMIDAFHQGGGISNITNKILKLTSMNSLGIFLLQQAIEVVYWGICFAFIFVIPNNGGVLLFAVVFLLSELEKHFNKQSCPAIHITDSLICICMYMLFGYFY